MMFNELDTSKNGVFPYQKPSNIPPLLGPIQSDLACMYFGAIFYDIAHDAGLGIHKADLLFWKTISLIDCGGSPSEPCYPMRKFGRQVQQAARLLWPASGSPNVSIYEEDIRQVLLSRGIAVDAPLPGEPNAVAIGAADFRTMLPPSICCVESSAGSAPFQAGHPNSQPTVNQYGASLTGAAIYTAPTTDVSYMAYTFYKHSKYGPCDFVQFRLNDDPNWTPACACTPNGTLLAQLEDREPGNITLLLPGHQVVLANTRGRCANEALGFYGEDVRPFGFRVLKATPNGFAFTVARTGEDAQRITYELTIVDPSLNLPGSAPGGGGPAEYAWTFTEFDGAQAQASGQSVPYAALRDQPFTISIDRTRAGRPTENLTLRERGNDLDRGKGQALVLNAVP
jgi:hypothetical protein